MNLSDIAIGRPVFTLMMSLALIVVGLLQVRTLPVEQFPPVDFPIMLVRTIWPGAAPEDIERDVTEKIEDAVASTPGLDELNSVTRGSASVVVMKFQMGTNLTDAVSTVRGRVGAVQNDLPDGVEAPVIQQIDLGALPVVVAAIATPLGTNATRDLVDKRLKPRLEQIEGVGAVNLVGGQDREIQIDLDLDALAEIGLAPNQIAERIGYENLSLPVGEFDQHGYTIGVRSEGQYTSLDDLGSTMVHMTREGRVVRLRDVATIRDGWSRPETLVRFDQREALSVEIIKRSGSNTIEVAEKTREVLAEVVPTLDPGAKYDLIVDTSRDIEANAHEVWIAIYFGGAMAVLVILFFLLDLRGTMISAMALPTSVIGTFALMGWLGFSFNTMTLLGLSLAIGLLIDDAVVVREAITQRLEAGDDPITAASRGTREVGLAVLATTLSLVAVFVPVAFMTGMVGQFFKQFGLTIAGAVMLSLFVAFTLDPMLSSRLSVRHVHAKRRGLAGLIERFLDALDYGYRSVLDLVLRWQKTTVFVTLLSLVFTVLVGTQIQAEFIPKEDRGDVLADLRLPVGTSLADTEAAARRAEQALYALPGVRSVYAIVGFESATQRARFRVKLLDKSERAPQAVFEPKIRAALQSADPRGEVNLTQPGVIDGLGDWPPVMLIVQGSELGAVEQEAERIAAILRGIPGASDVRTSIQPGRPEIGIVVDRDRASDMGVPAGAVGASARMLLEGAVVGSFRDGGPEADIRVRAAKRFVASEEGVRGIPLWTPRGVISVGDVAKVGIGVGESEIHHFGRLKSVTVSSQVTADGSLGEVLGTLQTELAKAPMAPGTLYTLSGQGQDMKETSEAMGLAVFTALVFIFMVLASQFESLLHPFTLLVSVPLAMVGAILALFLTGSSFSMGSQIGLILLMGLVTKNAILLVDGALQRMREGDDPRTALRWAGPRRLRPILMTSAAMVLGMLPTALGTGVGAEFRAPMAIAVIGGVLSSTLLTLLVVPVVFLWAERLRSLFARVTGIGADTPAAPPADGTIEAAK